VEQLEQLWQARQTELLYLGLALLLGIAGSLVARIRYQQKLAAAELRHAHAVNTLSAEHALELKGVAAEHARELGEIATEHARLQERVQQEGRAAAEKLELLQGARKQMGEEFNNLANRIFEEKSRALLENNKNTLQSTLSPLQTQLKDFRKKVEDVYDKETRDRVSLIHELGQLKELNKQMSEDALNLTRALKGDKKAQGNWGEVVLERVLEESGLRKGHEYETQFSTRNEQGQRRLPDVVIRLPEDKDIVIDSKVSLVDYERYVSSEDEGEKQAALVAHVQAIKNHISGLSIKEYENLEGLRSLDFVLLFIPIESAFMAAFDCDPSMFKTAYDKQVIVVSPTTLLATLRTVQTIWRYEQQNRNAEKIARQAGAIHDQFALVLESLADVGKHLERAQASYHKTRERMTTGRGNLTRRVQQLEELGAKTRKKLPAGMVETSGEDTGEDIGEDAGEDAG
jgi:DNA recombination protein RmuC